ncbi:penicillin acylase family protein [Pelomonas sp. SE-A7]|uniref:penicillin acylase family protein n=1 Tax=Pelomonas sp. SE-A7 TaxID=3054953 RepID=UPI00259CB261|nr:penicillin acylase family protein [Pelomonas sp. SE-A7]MDM4765628.1 penicillin acylase family protein [Pelomonas sp. SE-A7]
MRWFRRILLSLVLLLVLLAVALYLFLKSSLARLDGETAAPVSAAVELLRDERGYLTVKAQNEADVARGLGYAHGQERFFQMDLMRRNAAGELSALVGAKAVPLDQSRRLHAFRQRAERVLAGLPAEQRRLLEAYAQGVNEGLQALGARPFEYGLLRQSPQPWVPADSMLVVYGMYLDLQGSQGRDELATSWLKNAVPADWYAFLTQHSADWQAPLDGSDVKPVAVPASAWPWQGVKSACGDCGLRDSRDLGSNNFAVAGSRSSHGGAILADDMHLGLRVPGTWFKASLEWLQDGRNIKVSGVSLPGTPAIVAGSNGRVAWGFTNATADWADLVAVKLNAAGTHYQSPQGEKPLVKRMERIEVAGGPAVEVAFQDSEWGPLLPAPHQQYALHWVAHDPQALNFRLLDMARAASLDEAMQIAVGAGLPAQNMLVADAAGRVGWTIAGPVPLRQLQDFDQPQDWSAAGTGWTGYAAFDQHPRLLDPADGLLWTANARVVGGSMLALLGNGGYDLGARGQQIRDDLRAKPKHDEASLYAVQLDHRAVFLQRWRGLLLDKVLTPEFVSREGLADYRRFVETQTAEAAPGAVGYTLVRAFRDQVLERLFAPLATQLEAKQLRMRELKWVPENPGWALLQAGREDVLPAGVNSWEQLLQQAVLASRGKVQEKTPSLDQAGWGQHNKAQIQHPLSSALPFLASWLDMPATPMAGDRHMPRVQIGNHGQSERLVVSPGREASGILVVPGGQSGHPLSPFYRADHEAWLQGQPLSFLPGETRHRLLLKPRG